MKMGLILWDRFVRVEGFVHVDQQMVVTAVWSIATRLGDTHVAKTKSAPECTFDCRTIRRPDNIEKSVGGCLCSLRIRGGRKHAQHSSHQDRSRVLHNISPPIMS